MFFLLSVVVGLVLDLGTKVIAFREVGPHPVDVDRAEALAIMAGGGNLQQLIPPADPVTVVPHLLEFQLVLNAGAVFGTGSGQRWFFISFTIFALAFALLFFARWTQRGDRMAHLAIALVISGGIGNLYDRLVFGCVRDFIHPLPGVHLPFGLSWPNSGTTEMWPYVSNVADAFLLIGIGVLMIRLWGKDGGKKRESSTSTADAAG
ncbi:MAG: signal peptidase II [Phycisphaerales bacterium]|nr:signal peptidase II [Phycisphaerales bacterium]